MMKIKSEIHGLSEFANPMNKPVMVHSPNKQYPAKGKIESAGREMKLNPPAIMAKTKKKKGKKAARKQSIAIMLSKARKA